MTTTALSVSPSRSYLEQPTSARIIAGVILAHVLLGAWLSAQQTSQTPDPAPALMVQILTPAVNITPEAAPAPQKPVPPAPRRPQPRTAPPLLAAAPTPVPTTAAAPVIKETTAPSQASDTPAPSTPNNKTPVPAPAALVEARFDAAYLQNPAPSYPSIARRLGEQGRVILRVFVESTGMPGRIEIKSSSGFSRLDQSAQDAVQRWKFIPARRGDEVVAAWVLVPIEFNLRG